MHTKIFTSELAAGKMLTIEGLPQIKPKLVSLEQDVALCHNKLHETKRSIDQCDIAH